MWTWDTRMRRTSLFFLCPPTKIYKFSGNLCRNCPWSWGSVVTSNRGRAGVLAFLTTALGPQRWFPRPKTICRCWCQSADGKTGAEGWNDFTESQYHLVLTQEWNPRVWIPRSTTCPLGTALAQGQREGRKRFLPVVLGMEIQNYLCKRGAFTGLASLNNYSCKHPT